MEAATRTCLVYKLCFSEIGLDGAEHVLVDFRVERLHLGMA